jgi:hypothetical protein
MKGAMKTERCPGLAHRTVRCASGQCPVHQGDQLRTCHLQVSRNALRYNSPDYPVCHAEQQLTSPTVVCKSEQFSEQCGLRAQKSEQVPEGAPDSEQ